MASTTKGLDVAQLQASGSGNASSDLDGVKAAKSACVALREAFDLSLVEAPDLWNARSAPSSFAPSMGLEIEVPWSFYFPTLWERFGLDRGISALSAGECLELGKACSEMEACLLPKLSLSAQCGVPRGNDRYWEFAFDPCSDWRLACAQVELIAAAGLLPIDGKRSLQITLGSIRGDSGSQALARLFEAMASSPERLMAGLRSAQCGPIHTGWARKGSGGVLEKGASDLKLGTARACEFRTLSLPGSVLGLRSLLSAASCAGAALKASQQDLDSTEVLAWRKFKESVEGFVASEGISPLEWGKGQAIPVASWTRYADRFDRVKELVLSAWDQSGLEESINASPSPASRFKI